MLPPPPLPPLFPYTTLFRSQLPRARRQLYFGFARKMCLERRPEIAFEPRDPKYIRGQTHLRTFADRGHANLDHLTPPQHMRAERSEEHTSELQSRGHLVCRL